MFNIFRIYYPNIRSQCSFSICVFWDKPHGLFALFRYRV